MPAFCVPPAYFPDWLRPTSAHLFKDHHKKEIQNLLASDIRLHLVSRKSEAEFFDLDAFRISQTFSAGVNDTLDALADIRQELQDKGWNTALGFGNTALFIYSTESAPSNCW